MAKSAHSASRNSQKPKPFRAPVSLSRCMRSDTTGPAASNTSCQCGRISFRTGVRGLDARQNSASRAMETAGGDKNLELVYDGFSAVSGKTVKREKLVTGCVWDVADEHRADSVILHPLCHPAAVPASHLLPFAAFLLPAPSAQAPICVRERERAYVRVCVIYTSSLYKSLTEYNHHHLEADVSILVTYISVPFVHAPCGACSCVSVCVGTLSPLVDLRLEALLKFFFHALFKRPQRLGLLGRANFQFLALQLLIAVCRVLRRGRRPYRYNATYICVQ